MHSLASAFRFLYRKPLFTCAIVVPVAFGLGISGIVFGFINGYFLKPLKVANASELVRISLVSEYGQIVDSAVLGDDVWRSVGAPQYATIWQISGYGGGDVVASWRTSARRLKAETVVGSYFEALGETPVIGRLLSPLDDAPTAPAAVVISEPLWRTWFGGSSDAIGATVTVGGQPLQVVGVTPSSFRGVRRANIQGTDLWFPSRINRVPTLAIGSLFARRRPDVTLAGANAEFRTFHRVVERPVSPRSRPPNNGLILQDGLLPSIPPAGYALIAAVFATNGVLLTIVATSLASLLLARFHERRGELAIRVMLGCDERGIRRLLATETSLIILVAAAIALPATSLAVQLFPTNLLPRGSVTLGIDWSFDWRVSAYALTAMVTIAYVLVRIVSAHHASVDALATVSSAAGSGGATPLHFHTHRRLIAAQIGCSTVLLVLTGLFLRPTIDNTSLRRGLDVRGVAVAWIDHDQQGFNDTQRQLVNRRLQESIRTTDGVLSTGFASQLPGNRSGLSTVLSARDGTRDLAAYRYVSADFFSVIRLPLIRGRVFSSREEQDHKKLVVVSDCVASQLWKHQDPIGQSLWIGESGQPATAGQTEIVSVIGVVADVAPDSGDPHDRHFVYLPFDSSSTLQQSGRLAFLVKSNSERESVRAIHTAVARTSPDLVIDVRPASEEMAQNVTLLRRLSIILGGLGVFGLIVALISLYGVIAYIALQRSREIAIRKALGATPTALWRMLALEAVIILLRGLLPGLLISVMAGIMLSRYLPGIPAVDAAVLVFVGSCICLTGFVASVAPFRRMVYSAPSTELRAI